MEQTSIYNLNQWVEDDRIQREDFNADNAKIEAALTNAGNCRIAVGSYVGTGKYGASNPNTLTFDFEPQFLFLDTGTTWASTVNSRSVPMHFILYRNATSFPTALISGQNTLSWNGNSVSWYYGTSHADGATAQHNAASKTYHYIAIG